MMMECDTLSPFNLLGVKGVGDAATVLRIIPANYSSLLRLFRLALETQLDAAPAFQLAAAAQDADLSPRTDLDRQFNLIQPQCRLVTGLVEHVAEDGGEMADLLLQVFGADLHPLRQALAYRLHRARSETAAGILRTAAAFDNLHRFAGLHIRHEPQSTLSARHARPPLHCTNDPHANTPLPARQLRVQAVAKRRSADGWIVRPGSAAHHAGVVHPHEVGAAIRGHVGVGRTPGVQAVFPDVAVHVVKAEPVRRKQSRTRRLVAEYSGRSLVVGA